MTQNINKNKEFTVNGITEKYLNEEINDLAVDFGDEEKNLEMMISGGDYSPNSHTFFKHPF